MCLARSPLLDMLFAMALETATDKQGGTVAMRRNTLQIWVVILACTGLLTALAVADDDNEQGGDIQGTEQLDQEIVLTATTNAPAGASGQAKLEAEDADGTTTATLDVETQGLAAGTYTVSITK